MRKPRPIILPPSKIEEFYRLVNKKNEDECWEWNGMRGHGKLNNYGALSFADNKRYLAHRIAYFLANGIDPGELFCCHSCDNPPCCNPKHLFLGTSGDNTRDKIKKGRQARGSKSGPSKLVESQVLEIRTLYETGKYSQSTLAERFEVTRATIGYIIQNHVWKHVEHCKAQFGRRVMVERKPKGETHGSAKLTEKDVLEIRRRASEERATPKQLGGEYGIHPAVVSLIINRKRWKHI